MLSHLESIVKRIPEPQAIQDLIAYAKTAERFLEEALPEWSFEILHRNGCAGGELTNREIIEIREFILDDEVQFSGFKINNSDCLWFEGKGEIGEYILKAANAPERRFRLQYLSEGYLMYHMKALSVRHFVEGGCPKEKGLFLDFIKHVNKAQK